jgi:hypothetical protein
LKARSRERRFGRPRRSRSSTKMVTAPWPAFSGCSSTAIERFSAGSHTSSVSCAANEGSPRSCTYQGLAALKSRTWSSAKSARAIRGSYGPRLRRTPTSADRHVPQRAGRQCRRRPGRRRPAVVRSVHRLWHPRLRPRRGTCRADRDDRAGHLPAGDTHGLVELEPRRPTRGRQLVRGTPDRPPALTTAAVPSGRRTPAARLAHRLFACRRRSHQRRCMSHAG